MVVTCAAHCNGYPCLSLLWVPVLRPPYLFLRYFAHELKFSSCSFPSGWRLDALEEVGDDSFCNAQTKMWNTEKFDCFVLKWWWENIYMFNLGGLKCIIPLIFAVWGKHLKNMNTRFNDDISLALRPRSMLPSTCVKSEILPTLHQSGRWTVSESLLHRRHRRRLHLRARSSQNSCSLPDGLFSPWGRRILNAHSDTGALLGSRS